MYTYYGDCETLETDPCEVTIGDGQISVKYEWEPGQLQTYQGPEVGDGHFNLTAMVDEGKASLHRFPNGRILDGWWTEEGNEGMWRIVLNK
jgi:hypothetical protein